jgi:hypothetical protein
LTSTTKNMSAFTKQCKKTGDHHYMRISNPPCQFS